MPATGGEVGEPSLIGPQGRSEGLRLVDVAGHVGLEESRGAPEDQLAVTHEGDLVVAVETAIARAILVGLLPRVPDDLAVARDPLFLQETGGGEAHVELAELDEREV